MCRKVLIPKIKYENKRVQQIADSKIIRNLYLQHPHISPLTQQVAWVIAIYSVATTFYLPTQNM